MSAGQVRRIVPASATDVLDVLLDVDAYAAWQSHLRRCTVLERDAGGRAGLVETVIDAKVRTVRFAARYCYDLPHTISWRRVSGDLRELSARYSVTPGDGDRCEVAVDIDFDAGFYVPGPIRNRVRDQALRTWLDDLERHLNSTKGDATKG